MGEAGVRAPSPPSLSRPAPMAPQPPLSASLLTPVLPRPRYDSRPSPRSSGCSFPRALRPSCPPSPDASRSALARVPIRPVVEPVAVQGQGPGRQGQGCAPAGREGRPDGPAPGQARPARQGQGQWPRGSWRLCKPRSDSRLTVASPRLPSPSSLLLARPARATDHRQTADSMKRFQYLLGQTELFEHFLELKVRPSRPPAVPRAPPADGRRSHLSPSRRNRATRRSRRCSTPRSPRRRPRARRRRRASHFGALARPAPALADLALSPSPTPHAATPGTARPSRRRTSS